MIKAVVMAEERGEINKLSTQQAAWQQVVYIDWQTEGLQHMPSTGQVGRFRGSPTDNWLKTAMTQ